jgi:hypothetical protein
MKNESKKAAIKSLAIKMLNESHEDMLQKIDKALNSGAIDIDSWDENHNSMILPKCIVMAVLQNESTQYEGRGTSFEKQMKKEVSNIRIFL